MTETPKINWYQEVLRLVPLVIIFTVFLFALDKQIALNQDAVEDNHININKIMDNHLPHLDAKIDKLVENQTEMLKVIYDIKSLVK